MKRFIIFAIVLVVFSGIGLGSEKDKKSAKAPDASEELSFDVSVVPEKKAKPDVAIDINIDDIKFMTESYPPFNFKSNGRLAGIAVNLIEEMFLKVGSKLTRKDIEMLPWARAYLYITHSTKEQIGLFSMTRSKEREHLFKWVGPLSESRIVLIAPKSKKIVINSIDDINKHRVGVVRDDVGEQLLILKGVKSINLDVVFDLQLNALKLVRNRIDLWACGEIVAKWTLKQNNVNPNDYETVHVLQQGSNYFAFNLATDDQVINKLQKALDELKVDGTHEKILDRYLN